jgi:peptidoglycan DL-endopeptidase CwlO
VVTRPSVRGSLVYRALAGAVGVALVSGLITYSQAVGASPQPTISQVTAQVSALTTKEDRADQQYDLVNQQLTEASADLKQVEGQDTKDQAQFNLMRTDIAQVAATAYEDGNMTSMVTLLTSADPQNVLSKAAMLVQLSSIRSSEMDQFLQAARELTSTQEQEKRTEAAIAALRNEKKAQLDAIRNSLSQRKTLLATLTAQQQQQVETTSTTGQGGSTSGTDPLPATGSQADEAVKYVYDALGCPYLWGGTSCSPGYDCSGLVQAAWASAGVAIPRDTYEQWDALTHIPMSDLAPGDLIYYNGESHVAMYVGGGDIIDAPQTGMDVEKIPMDTSWYAENEDGAVQP